MIKYKQKNIYLILSSNLNNILYNKKLFLQPNLLKSYFSIFSKINTEKFDQTYKKTRLTEKNIYLRASLVPIFEKCVFKNTQNMIFVLCVFISQKKKNKQTIVLIF